MGSSKQTKVLPVFTLKQARLLVVMCMDYQGVTETRSLYRDVENILARLGRPRRGAEGNRGRDEVTLRYMLAFWLGLGCWTGLLQLVALTYGIPGVLIVPDYIFIPERVFLCAPPMALLAAACSLYCLRTFRRYA